MKKIISAIIVFFMATAIAGPAVLASAKGVGKPSSIAKKKEEKPASGQRTVYRWKKMGASPCVDCDRLEVFRNVIVEMDVPQEVKDQWFVQVGNKKSVVIKIKKGDRFDQMVFQKDGKFIVLNNVVADWPEGVTYDADLYEGVDCQGKRYFLVMPHNCKNWSWWAEDIKTEAPGQAPPPAPPVPKSYELPERYKIKPVEKSPAGKRRFDIDASAGYFHEQGSVLDGQWFSASLYPAIFGNPRQEHSFGVNVEQASWKGTAEDFNFAGDRLAFGPVYRYRTNRTETIARAGYGKIHDEGNISTPGGVFSMRQDIRIYTGYLSWEYNASTRFLSRYRVSVSGDLHKNGGRQASMSAGGTTDPLSVSAANKSAFNARLDLRLWDIGRKKTVSLTGGIGYLYYKEMPNSGVRVSLGLAFFDSMVEARYYWTDWQKGHSTEGIEVMANLSEIYKRLFPDKTTKDLGLTNGNPGDTGNVDPEDTGNLVTSDQIKKMLDE